MKIRDLHKGRDGIPTLEGSRAGIIKGARLAYPDRSDEDALVLRVMQLERLLHERTVALNARMVAQA